MKYFRYVGKGDTFLTFKIYQAIQAFKPLAISKYGANWEDALDEAYFHALEHYDESKGSIEHYAHCIVNTIYLNKYNREMCREVGSDVELDILNKHTLEDDTATPYDNLLAEEEDVEHDVNLRDCVRYLLPRFIKDYELFRSKDSSNRKMKYKGLFENYSVKVIAEAVEILTEYYDEAKYMGMLSKSCHARNFEWDRYKSSLDKTIAFASRIGDIINCKLIGTKRKKYAYSLNLIDLIEKIYIMFYSTDGIASRYIVNDWVYCSLSGQILLSKEELKETLEREIVGAILAMRTNLKVLQYARGSEIIFTSTNEDEPSVLLTMFKTGIYIPLTRLTIGKVEK